MRTYLATLHQRSERHKRHFSLGVASGVTLLIFGVWVLVNFGPANTPEPVTAENNKTEELGPFQSFGASISSGWDSVKASFTDIQERTNEIEEYQSYGR